MSWLPMKLIQCRFSSGQRVPLLVQTGAAAPLPVLVPFIYVQLKLRYRAYNTAAAHLRAIQAFYIYAKTGKGGLKLPRTVRVGSSHQAVHPCWTVACMTISTYPLFESHDDFVDQEFTVCRSSIRSVNDYLESFDEELLAIDGYLAARAYLRHYAEPP